MAVDETLCASTPCTLILPYGEHELTLVGESALNRNEISEIRVRVDEPYLAVRARLDRTEYASRVFVGLAVAGAGATMSVVGLLSAGSGRSETGKTLDAIAIVGLVPLAIGLVIAAASSTEHQAGSATQWNPKTAAVRDGLTWHF